MPDLVLYDGEDASLKNARPLFRQHDPQRLDGEKEGRTNHRFRESATARRLRTGREWKSIIGVVIAAIVAFSGVASPLALVGPDFVK